MTRSLTYRLEAGDARSLDYAITVVPAASILVERVEYDYPEYTGYVDRSVEGVGDIRAIEGTRSHHSRPGEWADSRGGRRFRRRRPARFDDDGERKLKAQRVV